MKLILGEKPSQSKLYAQALGVSNKKDGYFEGNGYIITWCIGHLVELANADLYDERYKKWNIADLPIIPKEWRYAVSDDKKKQFNIVKTLMNDDRVTEVIFATDAGREGELIARLVYEKANCKKPIKRLWLSSMEETAIRNGFNNLKDGAEYENLYHSALCRSKADWIVGINGTRIFTKLYNKKLNVGRVQTPTLAMICERSNAISNFIKEKYFNVHLKGTGLLEKIREQSEADKIKAECNGKSAIVRSVKHEKKSVNPPKLYDLTTLQREANRLYGFTAQQTLDYTQSLYEMRLVTYPRTDSQYLTDDMGDTVKNVLDIILKFTPAFDGIGKSEFNGVSNVLNSKKITDHTAVIPTAELAKASLDSIPEGERKILFLIANRLVCAVADKYEYEAVTAEIECNGYTFVSKGKTVIFDGWKAFDKRFRAYQKCNSESEESADITLDLKENQTLENVTCSVTEHYTSPPKPYTEDTLLSAMERAGADEITEDTERSGLGTPATRASIIEKLIKSGFIKREKKNLSATDEGTELITLMPDFMKSAKLTAGWENILSLIAKGDYPADNFMDDIKNLVTDIISSAKENVKPEFAAKSVRERIGACPRCGKDVVEYPKSFSCESGKDGCGFTLWKNNKFFESAKKEFTKEIAAALVNNGKCEVSGLYSPKTGKTYNAVICLDDTGTWVNFKLEFAPKSKRRS
jgi:DNA topoisomerase-3